MAENNYSKLEEFICDWAKKYNYFHSDGTFGGDVASDLACDLKSDIEASEFNPINKSMDNWEDVYDEWYDDFAEVEIIPLLLIHGAVIESTEEFECIEWWTSKYCTPFMTTQGEYPIGYDHNWVIFKSNTEERYFLFDSDKEDLCFQEIQTITQKEHL